MKMINIIICMVMVTFDVMAQNMNFGSKGGDITISASDGVEWNRETKEIIINQDATMIQGDTTLVGDVIKISYDEIDKKQELTLLKANGNVKISTSGENLSGDEAIYEPHKNIAILTGANPKLNMASGTITAKIFEYYPNQSKAVARENVELVSDKGNVKSKTAVAYLSGAKNNTNNSSLSKLELFEDVTITTEDEIVKGDTAVYNLDKGLITVKGNVILQKGKNNLRGDIGEVNLKTGISRLQSLSKSRVGGSISPAK